jgi:hypothetical protein
MDDVFARMPARVPAPRLARIVLVFVAGAALLKRRDII